MLTNFNKTEKNLNYNTKKYVSAEKTLELLYFFLSAINKKKSELVI